MSGGVMVTTAAQLDSTKSELRLYTGLNTSRRVLVLLVVDFLGKLKKHLLLFCFYLENPEKLEKKMFFLCLSLTSLCILAMSVVLFLIDGLVQFLVLQNMLQELVASYSLHYFVFVCIIL